MLCECDHWADEPIGLKAGNSGKFTTDTTAVCRGSFVGHARTTAGTIHGFCVESWRRAGPKAKPEGEAQRRSPKAKPEGEAPPKSRLILLALN